MRSARSQRSVHGALGVARAHGGRAGEATPGIPAEEPAQGGDAAVCGWFESSRTLREGTEVREHEVLDAIVNDLPLAWWIEWAGLHADARRA